MTAIKNKLRINEAANYIGVSAKTLRRWEKKGKLVAERSVGDQRYYSQELLDNFLRQNNLVSTQNEAASLPKTNNQKSSQKTPTVYKYLLATSVFSLVFSFVLQSKIFKDKSVDSRLSTADSGQPSVLAASTGLGGVSDKYTFTVNVPSEFNDLVVFNKDIAAPNIVTSVNNKTGDVNLNLTAGDGITVDGLKITNSGIVTLAAGTGISIEGNKITNSGIVSLKAGAGISVSGNTITNTLNLSDSGWTDNGTSVTLTTTTDSVTVDALTAGAITATSLNTGGLSLTNDLTVASGYSLLPSTDLGSDIGTSSKRFNNLWVANINSNSSQSFSGQTTFSYAPTDTTITQASVIINPTTSAANGQLLGLGIAGYQRALIDEDGDIILGYSDATSAPASDYPLNIYGHNGTRVAYIDTAGLANVQTLNLANNALTSSGALTITPAAGSNLNIALSTTGDFAVNTNQLYVDTSTGKVGIGTTNPSSRLVVNDTPSYSLASTPTIALGDGDTGFFEQSDDTLSISLNGSREFMFYNNGYEIAFGGVTGLNSNLRNVNASSTVPGFVFRGDENTGLGTAGGDILSLIAGGTNIANITTTGIGIGTTAPTSKLHVTGAVTGKALAIFDETGNQDILVASASGTNRFVIKNDGKVGIGTTSPQAQLQVGATSVVSGSNVARFTSSSTGEVNNLMLHNIGTRTTGQMTSLTFANGDGIGILSKISSIVESGTYNDGLAFYTASGAVIAERLRIAGNGNVGIGTSSPTSKLHVSGAVTGKALAIFDETGDQALLTASASGVTKFVVSNSGNVGVGTSNTNSTITLGSSRLIAADTSDGTDNGCINISGGGGLSNLRGAYGIFCGNENASAGNITLYMGSSTGTQSFTVTNGTVSFYYDETGKGYFYGGTPKIGIGTTGPNSTLGILGNLAVGSTYGTATAPTSGALIEGLVGIGTTVPTSKLHVSGAVTGKALAIFDETGNQNIFTASASGITKLNLTNTGILQSYASIVTYGTENGGTGTGAIQINNSGALNLDVVVGSSARIYTSTGYPLKINSSGSGVYESTWTSTNGDLALRTATLGNILLIPVGNVGIGSTSPTSKLHVTGAVTGKALAIFDETGNQALLTASASGTTKLSVLHNGLVDATAGGLATFVKAGTISDADFNDTEVDGLLGVDATNDRLYIRNSNGVWNYIAFTAGFQIPDFEAGGLSEGDYLIPYVEKTMSDGAVHGLYAKWNDVKDTLLAEIKNQISQIKSDIEKFVEKFTTKEICLSAEDNSQTCIKKEQLDELIKLLPTSTPTPTVSPSPSVEPTTPATEAPATPVASPSATPLL